MIEFTVEDAPASRRPHGVWSRFMESVRALPAGKAATVTCDRGVYLSARASVFHKRNQLPGEKWHCTYSDGVMHVWVDKP